MLNETAHYMQHFSMGSLQAEVPQCLYDKFWNELSGFLLGSHWKALYL